MKRIKNEMGSYKRLTRAFENAPKYNLTDHSMLAIISDCHRGNGNTTDNFLKNRNLYDVAMAHYYKGGYTYVELGDGDELWENKNFSTIKSIHHMAFEYMEKFKEKERFIGIFGNHDICKSKDRWCRKGFCDKLPEAVIFEHKKTGLKIGLTHGHQSQAIDSILWPIGMILVRFIWKPMEHLGFRDPTNAAVNNHKISLAEERMKLFAKNYGMLLIAGHTHKPTLPSGLSRREGKLYGYMNTGSCIHPEGITCIEVIGLKFKLVKWICRADEFDRLSVVREIIDELDV